MSDKNFETDDVKNVEELSDAVLKIKNEISKKIIGQTDIIDKLLVSLFSQGHCLLIGVPGLAKTLLIKTISEALDLDFSRIQFTPDLMPSDITGTEIIEDDRSTKKRSFRFIKGPVFANIILADEINRTPPKTQAALLEAMQEHFVTSAGQSYRLSEPFFVLATQNPIEQEGTYPLPEAQLDRFMFSLRLDYPSYEEELEIIKTTTGEFEAEIDTVIGAEKIIQFQNLIRRVPAADNVIEFAVQVVNSTRKGNKYSYDEIIDLLSWGAGPRASQYLILAAKTNAVINGRFTPNIDDVKEFIMPVLSHRIIPTFGAEAEGITSQNIIQRIIENL